MLNKEIKLRMPTMVECMVFVGILFVPLIWWVAVEEQRQWNEYVEANNCKVVESRRTRTPYYDANLKTTSYMYNNERKYLCDGGVIHWR